MKIILIGHGKTAIALKEATEMIFGKADFLIPVTFLPHEGLEELTKKLENQITKFNDNEDILVMADLFSGTPYNAAATLALKGKVKDVIAGLSLPMCLDAASTFLNDPNVEAIIENISHNNSSYVKVLSDIIKEETDEEEL